VVLSPQADLLGKVVGYVSPGEYRRTLNNARRLQKRIAKIRSSPSNSQQ